MSQKVGKNNNKVYRLVLTGGPCGGKTTGQARLCTFFENLGWKVYRVPESATILMGGGVKWTSLSAEEIYRFQANLLQTMMQIENTFFDLAASCSTNCLVICDRGAMDATAYMKPHEWEHMKEDYNWNEVDLRDSRYNQVIHLISAARGAEVFYETDSHVTRHEGVDLARELDDLTSQAWVGHPYFDVIDNSTDFERKIVRMIAAVCNRLGIEAGDRLSLDSKKRKFLVRSLPDDLAMGSCRRPTEGLLSEAGIAISNSYPQFQDFIVVHDYLVTPNQKSQARIRRRGQNVKWDPTSDQWNLDTVPREMRYQVSRVSLLHEISPSHSIYTYGTDQEFSHWTYTHTIRRPEINQECPECKMQISSKEYQLLVAQRDAKRYTIFKKRRCFLWNNTYFQMDIYQEPCHSRCKGLIILETYTTQKGDELKLPDFLDVVREVTKESYYSMYNLSRKDNLLETPKKQAPSTQAPQSVGDITNGTSALHLNGPPQNGHVSVSNGLDFVNGHA